MVFKKENSVRRYVFASIIFLHVLISCGKKSETERPVEHPPVTAEVTIFNHEEKQVIQGFGCATAFNPPNTSAITAAEFDRLFQAGDGQVGLSILRIKVSPENDTWRNTELQHAKEATARGARVIASPWSPPTRMKTNNNMVGGRFITDSGANYARYLNDFADYMHNNGASLYAVSVQNEPDIKVDYEGCEWSPEEMLHFVKEHGHLITATKLMAPESFNNNPLYANTLLSDATASGNLDIVAAHIYGSGIVENLLAKERGKEMWMTEHLDTLTTYAANLKTAVEIHDCLTKANFNAYLWWYGKRFYGPIGQDGMVTKRGFILSQFARFIRPGSVRLGTSLNSRANVLVSAYTSGLKKVVVAINTGTVDVEQKIAFAQGPLSDVVPYTTTAVKNTEKGVKVAVANNTFIYRLPAGSVTTFVEQ